MSLMAAGVLAIASLMASTVMADSTRVVTLGADLSEEQKTALLKYFGVYGQSIRTLYVNNQNERDNLGAYIPLSVIGDHTYSSALVNPTSSGGIQVKTANLTWVTGNMIASTLSTAGVKNCEVLAASPFPVSGTGALTGVMMAFESASATTLDPVKKDIANQEIVTTGTIAEQVGQTNAANIVNEIKIQVIEGQVVDKTQVEQIVDEVVNKSEEENVVYLSEEDRDMLTELAGRIAEQQYDYDDVRETLERVEQNTSNADVNVNVNVEGTTVNNNIDNSNSNTNSADNTNDVDSNTDVDNSSAIDGNTNVDVDQGSTQTNEDSILNQADASALGSDIVVTTTDEPEAAETELSGEQGGESAPFEIMNQDSFSDGAAAEITEGAQDAGQNVQDAGIPDTDVPNTDTSDVTADGSNGTQEAQMPETQPGADSSPDIQAETEVPADAGQDTGLPQLVLDNTTVELLPAETDNVAGLNLLCLRIGKPDIQLAANEDGSFGRITVQGPNGETVINLQDAADPSQVDKKVVEIEDMDGADSDAKGWTEGGTEIFINLGTALNAADLSSYTINIQDMQLVQKVEDGTILAQGTFNTTRTVYSDEIGFTFNDISDIHTLAAGQDVSGTILMPQDAEDGSMVYQAYVEDNELATFTMDENGRTFTAQLNQAGIADLVVEVSSDGGNTFIPYTFRLMIVEPAQPEA